MNIAIIGTDGLPARYGGFETFVEQIAPRLAKDGHNVRVIGSSKFRSPAKSPRADSVEIINIGLSANGASSVIFDVLSFIKVMFWADAVLVLGVSAGLFVPFMRLCTKQGRLIVNVDGLESRRAKWYGFRRLFLVWSEYIAVKFSPITVADNDAIADIISKRYQRIPTTIAYGADHVQRPAELVAKRVLEKTFHIEPNTYALTVARIEPENHILEMIDGFLDSKLSTYVLVGNFETTTYGRQLKIRFGNQNRIIFIDSNYDPLHLACLRMSCLVYLHGHSVGGTNPSLVEMLPYNRPILAWDCEFNRATLRGECGYFDSSKNLSRLLEEDNLAVYVPSKLLSADPAYCWNNITIKYLQIINSFASG